MIQEYNFNALTSSKIEQRRTLAKQYAAEGNIEKAILEYNRIIFLSPNAAEFYEERAELYIRLTDIASAIANLRKSLKLKPSKETEQLLKDLCFIKGLTLVDEGKVPSAMYFLEHNFNKDDQYHYLRALGFLSTGEKHLALKELEQAIEFSPQTATDALVLKGKILWSLDKKNEGNDAFWKAFNLNSSHPDVKEFVSIMRPMSNEWLDKATKAIFDNDLKLAMYCINKGLNVYRDSPKLLLLRASIQRQLQNYEEALDDLERASLHMNFENISEQVRTQIALTYNDIGQALFKEKRYQDAITPFNEAINFLGGDSGLFINRGDCYRMRAMNEVALADYHHAVELGASPQNINPRLAAVHYAIALELYNQTDYSGSSIECSRALSYNGIVPEYFVARAKAQINLGSQQNAYEDLQRALAISPAHEEAHRLLSNFKSTVKSIPLNIQKLMYKRSKK
jgi:tetratricopeptide (TPR) repeat protein